MWVPLVEVVQHFVELSMGDPAGHPGTNPGSGVRRMQTTARTMMRKATPTIMRVQCLEQKRTFNILPFPSIVRCLPILIEMCFTPLTPIVLLVFECVRASV